MSGMNFILPTEFLLLTGVGAAIKSLQSRFQLPPKPKWPEDENQNLAAELAPSLDDCTKFLGPAGSDSGRNNRQVLARVQYLDFVFIVLYVAFFSGIAVEMGGRIRWAIAAFGLLTGLLDVGEDFAILKITKDQDARPVMFGASKWFFYFLTVGLLSFIVTPWPARPIQSAVGLITAIALGGAALAGVIGSARRSFSIINSAAMVSAVGLLGVVLYPFAGSFPFPTSLVATYLMLERAPALFALVMIAIAFLGKAPGLHDVGAPSIFAVSLAAAACGEAIASTAEIIFKHAPDRIPGLIPLAIPQSNWPLQHPLPLITAFVSAPLLLSAVSFSSRQGRNPLRLSLSAIAGFVSIVVGAHYIRVYMSGVFSALVHFDKPNLLGAWMTRYREIFNGYGPSVRTGFEPTIVADHLAALTGFLFTAIVYAALGIYGRFKLGKARTVPALCSAVMLLMGMCWMCGALTFFFDLYRIPILLVMAVGATITAQSSLSDHYYKLIQERACSSPPTPERVIGNRERLVVVAANGGGIQAAAWAARVLAGLHSACPNFSDALRMISSVSGGSVGSAMFLDRLESGCAAAAPKAAQESSLDEVSWGLAWPDFLISLCPWVFGNLFSIGRGEALEEAWVSNCGKDSHLNDALSRWNQKVADGILPAIIMNATIVETGQRLLLGTTQLSGGAVTGRARIDAAELYKSKDVSVVTAARLSATFPYVTPASRADAKGPQPHVVDGGYYDNYGMATLVEWLDEALRSDILDSVLVLQVHGAPIQEKSRDKLYSGARGWFYQAWAPFATLFNVRSSGQVAHNDVELGLLQEAWFGKKKVHSLEFEFPDENAPLSWHLTPKQQAEIVRVWDSDPKIQHNVKLVCSFLEGGDDLKPGCRCPECRAS